jgi:glycerate kinase
MRTRPTEKKKANVLIHKDMTITLAFDSFKGSLRSDGVADAFEEGLRTVLPDCEVRKAYVADGGEGTMEAIVRSLNGKIIETTVSDPIGRRVIARYGIIDNGQTAVIEMAEASGLTLLKPEERNPMQTTTFGTGELIADAIGRGCRKFLIGIGGSATNDGGTGMLSALGFRFLDNERNPLRGCGSTLAEIVSIDESQAMSELKDCEFVVACDVTAPLYGPNGAAHVFAPQKGADEEMVEKLDKGLMNFAETIRKFNGKDVTDIPGGGAAGGMGAGMCALLNARLERGIDMVLNAIRFDDIITGSSLVVTGEGKIDRQTIMGKAPSGILRRASAQGIPVIAIGGKIDWCDELKESGFAEILSINTNGMPTKKAMQRSIAYENVKRMGSSIALRYVTPDKK